MAPELDISDVRNQVSQIRIQASEFEFSKIQIHSVFLSESDSYLLDLNPNPAQKALNSDSNPNPDSHITA